MRGTIPTVNEPHADDTRSSEEREHEHSLRGTAVAVTLMALFIIGTSPAPGAPPVKSFRGSEGGNKMPVAEAASASEAAGVATRPSGAELGTEIKADPGENAGKLSIKLDTPSVRAGRVTFAVNNIGKMPHDLVVLKTDTPADKLPAGEGGKAKETGRVGKVELMSPGADTMYLSMDMKPGKYVIICNVPGRYGLGQYTSLEVA